MLFQEQQINYKCLKTNPTEVILRYHKIYFDAPNTLVTRTYRILNISCVSHDKTRSFLLTIS